MSPGGAFCTQCGRSMPEDASFCAGCGKPRSGPIRDRPDDRTPTARPIAGIVIGGVLSGIGVAGGLYGLANALNPTGSAETLSELFPGAYQAGLVDKSLGLLLNTALLIGVLLSFLNHPNGNRTVRVVCGSWIAVAVLWTFLILSIMTTSPNWNSADLAVKHALIGGIVGYGIGSVLQNSLILFLFWKYP